MEEHIIIFKDSSTRIITFNQYRELMNTWKTKELAMLNGTTQIISARSINSIVPLSEYYAQNPNKRPVSKNSLPLFEAFSLCRGKRSAAEGMLMGFEQYIAEKGGIENCGENTKTLYKKLQDKVKLTN